MGWQDSAVLEAVLHDAEDDNVDGIEIPVSGVGLLRLHVVAADSWDGTGTFQGSIDKANPVGIQAVEQDSDTKQLTATGTTLNMIYLFDVAGLDWFKVPITGRTGGSVTMTARGVPA